MRAIDAYELKRSLAVSALIEDQKTLEQIIDEQPTIEERKTGKWIFKEDFRIVGYEWKCDQCGSWQRYISNYCPNCGADMRGET